MAGLSPVHSSVTPVFQSREGAIVVFDLETTGFSRTSDITQIAAVCGDEFFNTYVMPTQPITPGASRVTGITLEEGQLYCQGEPVDAVSPQVAMISFMDFLSKFKNPVLIGHNIKNFDIPVLENCLKPLNMWPRFLSFISGLSDTLPMFRMKFPGRASYKQVDLIRDLLGQQYNAHNALEDVKSLAQLVKQEISPELISKCIFSANN